MPGQAGAATTLYTNTTRVGWIIAGSLAGVVAEIWNYHTVFWIALVMCVLTLSCLTRIKDVLRRGERFQLKQISDGLLARTAAIFRRQAGARSTPSGVKASKKIMHRLESRAERSGYWQACLVACLEWA